MTTWHPRPRGNVHPTTAVPRCSGPPPHGTPRPTATWRSTSTWTQPTRSHSTAPAGHHDHVGTGRGHWPVHRVSWASPCVRELGRPMHACGAGIGPGRWAVRGWDGPVHARAWGLGWAAAGLWPWPLSLGRPMRARGQSEAGPIYSPGETTTQVCDAGFFIMQKKCIAEGLNPDKTQREALPLHHTTVCARLTCVNLLYWFNKGIWFPSVTPGTHNRRQVRLTPGQRRGCAAASRRTAATDSH